MATTRHILVMETTGKARGSHGRIGIKAKLAAGLAILGCAAALAFGWTQLGNTAQSKAAQSVASALDWEQVERTQVAPSQAVAILDWEQVERTQVAADQSGVIFDWEQAERRQVAPSFPVVALDWEQLERTQVAPSLPIAPVDWEQEERRQVAP